MKYLALFITFMLSVNLYSQDIDYFPTSTTGRVIEDQHYLLSYDEQHEQAEWVAYELTPSEVKGSYDRTDNFRRDPKVETGSATLADYRGSGYDRGHLAPAADMSYSRTAMSQSFYLSNMTPQEAGFNRGIWRQLESQVREWTRNNGSIYVATGPVLSGRYKEEIGPNDLSVPTHYYKVILDYDRQAESKAIAFIMPNEKGEQSLKEYATTIDAVERRTGIDFFHELPDNTENKLESSVSTDKWTVSSSSGSYGRNYNKNQYHTDSDNKININTASRSKLKSLDGIGEVLSGRIIHARPFGDIHEMKDVKGIGPKTFEDIRREITAE